MALTEAEKQFVYASFRMKMWGQGRGTYKNIDQDFADGLLDKEWREFVDGWKSRQESAVLPKEGE